MLNIPKHIVSGANWKQGSNFEVAQKDATTIELKYLAPASVSRRDASLASIEQDAMGEFGLLLQRGHELSPALFNQKLGALSHTLATMRRSKRPKHLPIS